MTVKRLTALLLVSALLLSLAACSGTKTPSEAPSETSSAAATPSDLAEFNDPNILNTEYTREKCLELPLVFSTDFAPTDLSDCAGDFAAANYAGYGPSNITVCNKGGNTVPAETAGTENPIATASYQIFFDSNFKVPGLATVNDSYTFLLQVIAESTEDGYKILGFDTRQDRQICTRAELARFLGVTAAQPLPSGENITAVNLTEDYGVDRAWCGTVLGADRVALLNLPAEYTLTGSGPAFQLMIVDLAQKKLITAIDIPDADRESGAQLKLTAAGNLCITVNDTGSADGRKALCFYSPDGLPVDDTAPAADYSTELTLSEGVTVYNDNNDIKMKSNGKKSTLLKGNTADEVDEWRCYRVVAVLDQTRFIYSSYGYEWSNGSFIYDIKTKESTEIAFEEDQPLNAAAVYGTTAVMYEYTEGEDAPAYVVDLSGNQPAARVLCTGDGCGIAYASFSEDGSRILTLHTKSDADGNRASENVELYDTQTCALLSSADLTGSGYNLQNPVFAGENRAVAFTSQWACSDALLFIVDLP